MSPSVGHVTCSHAKGMDLPSSQGPNGTICAEQAKASNGTICPKFAPRKISAYLALGARPQAGENAKETRLAASVWTSDQHTLPLPNCQVQILYQKPVSSSSFRVYLITGRRNRHSVESDGVAPFLAYPRAQGSRAGNCTKKGQGLLQECYIPCNSENIE
jgi:hypothetical protein